MVFDPVRGVRDLVHSGKTEVTSTTLIRYAVAACCHIALSSRARGIDNVEIQAETAKSDEPDRFARTALTWTKAPPDMKIITLSSTWLLSVWSQDIESSKHCGVKPKKIHKIL
jgi:hypothetical protein